MKALFPPDGDATTSFSLSEGALITDPTPLQGWDMIKSLLKSKMSAIDFTTYIEALSFEPRSDHEITLRITDSQVHGALIEQHLESIETSKDQLGLCHLAIRLVSSLDDESCLQAELAETIIPQEPPMGKGLFSGLESSTETPSTSLNRSNRDHHPSSLSPTSKLNPFYTFDSFVSGPSNQFALASCLNVSSNLGVNYNPLFIYGSTGLGKTHLLHAVGNQILKDDPTRVVTYISSERFMNEMIYCIRHSKMLDFRQKYRSCDVLMMDDIQFISGNKAATQEEFFHTFNTLYEAKKQIVITSDLFPQDIPDIEERLRNRFQWGLIADIQAPDLDHRIAILQRKSKKLEIKLNDDLCEFIAQQAKSNVRELEGALHRIVAFAALQGRPITKNVALEVFSHVKFKGRQSVETDDVQKIVADHFKVRLSDLRSKKRQRNLTLPRQVAMYLVRHHTQLSFPDIGLSFGGKDHSTIMYAYRKIQKSRQSDPELRSHLEALERRIDGH